MSRSQRLCSLGAAVVVLVVLCLNDAEGGTIERFPRAIDESNNASEGNRYKICHRSTPCAWEIYVPFTREVNHYMPNTCKCPVGTECVKTDDDLSVSAYVHRCRERPTNASS